jgi:NAD(P)-dependent dehydrogenase (short-subunit alcohol dehydrogenase family)
MEKVYAIFGATGGIGSSLSKTLSSKADRVYLLGRDEKKLQALAQECEQPYMLVDATDENSVASCLEKIIEKEGRIDGVASLVGSVFIKPLQSTTQKEFEEILKTNTVSVVLSSSTASLIGLTHHEAIACAKSGVNGLVLSSAASYASKKIRVNAIAPGLTKTKQTAFITDSELALKTSLKLHPLGRIAAPEEVASLVAWLLSDESSFITAAVIPIDGGLSSIK